MALLLACSPTVEDTAVVRAVPTFSAGTLDPPFEHANAVWAGVALADFDGDGWLDIFATNGENHPDALYLNDGDGSFTDHAVEAGLDSLLESGAATAGDIDNDGDMDLIVSEECSAGSYGEAGGSLDDGNKRLYLNEGDGTFVRHPLFPTIRDTDEPSLLAWCTTSMTLADWNGDGWLDLHLSNGLDPDIVAPWVLFKSEFNSRNAVLLGDGRGNFDRYVLEQTEFDDLKYTASFASAIWDVDGDGRDDIVTGQGGYEIQVFPQTEDELYSLGRRTGLSDHASTGIGLWMGLAVADFDNDLDLDVYATNQGHSTRIAGYDNHRGVSYEEGSWIEDFHRLFLAQDGMLEQADWPLVADHLLAGDVMDAQGLDRLGWGWGAVPIDADADGRVDVAWTGNNCSPPLDVCYDEARGAGPGALLLNEGGSWLDATWDAGVANADGRGRYLDGRGVATGDLDNDGHADLVVANRSFNPSQSDPLAQELGGLQIWLSGERHNHWLQLDLVGSTSNRDGIGALVIVRTDELETLHRLGAGGSTCASSERLLSIGLGAAETADLEIRFPSGEVVLLEDVEADQRLVVEEPS